MNHSFGHGAGTFDCETCGKAFKKMSDKKRHIMVIHDGVKFPCALCDKSFKRKDNLAVHISMVHDKDKVSCQHCGIKLSTKSNLSRHIKTFHANAVEGGYVCECCDGTFPSQTLLQIHVKKVHKKFKCLECNSRFTKKSNLKDHEKNISVKCIDCNKKFCTKRLLRDHVKSEHDDNERYTCDLCDGSFSSKFRLKTHVQMRKLCLCDTCGIQLCNKRDKTLHIQRYHKVRKCDLCGTTRTSLEFLKHHISVKHAEMADIVDKDVGTPQEITFESLKPDINGLFTIFFITDAQYPTVREEFRKSGKTEFDVCSGRYEGSFLISFKKAADLWSALSAHKEALLSMRNLKLVFEDDSADEPEDDHEKDDDGN